MDNELKEKLLTVYLQKLSQVNVDTSAVSDEFKDKLKNASFTCINDHGNAYEGSLLEIVLKILTPYAIKLNELLPKEIQVDKNTLVKICLLHHLGKTEMFVPNDNQWEIEKRGMVFKYNNEIPAIKNGLLSVSIASNEFNVAFTASEIEAMTINDRDSTDTQARYFASPLASIIRQANELTYIQINNLPK